MKNTILIFLSLLLSGTALAQNSNSTIKGTLSDSTETNLVGATAILYYQADSVLAGFVLTDEAGLFEMPKVAPGNYYLQFSYIGFENLSVDLSKEQFDGEVDLGTIMLKNANVIEGVVIQRAPLEVRKDTIVYDATVFETRPSATVEDLLKKLPGIEVEDDGTIKAQGEDVQNVLVDGKKFFGDDPKVATRNIPADAVQNVEVYDKKSEKAEFTGVDDGVKQKTINLDLKDDRKNGVFGNAYAGAGTEDLYSGKVSLSRFSPGLQLSTIVSRNNVNDQAFTQRDYIGMNGGSGFIPGARGGGSFVVFSGNGNSPTTGPLNSGINTSSAAGVNLNATVSEKSEIHFEYFYNDTENNFDRQLSRQEFLNQGFLTSDQNTFGSSENSSHRLGFDWEYKLDSLNEIEFNNNLTFSNQSYLSNSFTKTFGVDGALSNDNTNMQNNNGDSQGIRSELFYKRRFRKKGRSFFAELGVNSNNSDYINLIDATTNLIESSEIIPLNQRLNADNASTAFNGLITYTEPVGNNNYLEVGYNVTNDEDNSDQDYFDRENGQDVFNDRLSNQFQKDYISQSPSLTYRITTGKHNINVGTRYEFSNLEGSTDLSTDVIRKEYNQLLPSLDWNIDLGQAKNLGINYSSSLSEPSVRQLQPVADLSNPLNIYTGNPNLEAEIAHNTSLRFFTFDRFSFTNFFVFANFRYVSDKIVEAQTFDAANVRRTTPVNTDSQFSSNANLSFSKPIRALRTRIRIGTGLNRTAGELFLNGQPTDFTSFNQNYNLSLDNTNEEKVDISLRGRWSFNNQKYSENEALDQDFLTQRYTLRSDFTIKKNWEIGSTMNYNVYSEEQFGDDNTFALWNAYMSRSIMSDLGEIRLSMLSFRYKFLGTGKKGKEDEEENKGKGKKEANIPFLH